jgi:predicted O-methyltransferase YrrM
LLAAKARDSFARHGVDDRIEVIEGKAEDVSVDPLTPPFCILHHDGEIECNNSQVRGSQAGKATDAVSVAANMFMCHRLTRDFRPFDLIFVDLEFSMYKPIVSQILDRGLLTSGGIILVDNGTSCMLFLA